MITNTCLGMPRIEKKEIVHPELKDDEVFLTNVFDPRGIFLYGRNQFNNINYKTKRLGKIAYNENGKKNEQMFPVFIKKWEMHKKN